MKLYALVTDEGRACSETCLCDFHFTTKAKEFVLKFIDIRLDVLNNSWTDCSENNELECVLCGILEIKTCYKKDSYVNKHLK